MYSVQAAARMTGLRPDTLRVWERRYSVVQPQRDARGRRLYTSADVYRLGLLQQGIARGHTIGHLVTLSVEQLQALLDAPGALDPPASRPEPFAARLVEAAAADDGMACDAIVGLALASLSPRTFVQDVLAPALRTVGERWCHGEMGVAQEHVLTTSIQRALMAVLLVLQKAAHGPRIVLGTLSGERHELGLLCAAFLAAHQGWHCHYLGAEVPAAELARVVQRVDATVLGVSLVCTNRHGSWQTPLRDLCTRVSRRAEVWLGGAAALALTPAEVPPGCVLITDMAPYEDRLRVLRTLAG